MRFELPWLWNAKSRKLLWLLGLTFAIVVTFQYIELPDAISSMFYSTKIPISKNETSLIGGDLTPALAPSFSNGGDEEVEVDKIFDTSGNVTAPTIAPALPPSLPGLDPSLVKLNVSVPAKAPAALLGSKINATAPAKAPAALLGSKENLTAPASSAKPPAASPGLSPSLVKDNATAPVASAKSPAGLKPYPVKEKATTPTSSQVPEKSSTKPNGGNVSPLVRFVPDIKENWKRTHFGVMSISEMSKKLHQNRISLNRLAKKPKWVTKPDLELLQAKYEIENAPIDDKDPLLYAPLYRNVSTFKRSYELMEKILKVYVYKEGSRPIMHTPILKGIYASEGWFMKIIESNNKFVTNDASKAHLFYIPFSSRMLEVTLYVQDSHSHQNLNKFLKDYKDTIAVKYHFWNRTSGADHFLVACHDWAPSETRTTFAKSIRAMCNTDVKEGFVFGKDTSLPETLVVDPRNPLKNIGGKSASERPTLAFFAGKPDHGYLRPILLSYWGNNKDPDLKIFGKLPRIRGNTEYLHFMKTSKYCICAKGFEVNSPRVVEAIFYDCVPVIISDNFVPPLFDVLNWEAFALFIPEKDVPNLKKILMAVPEKRYKEMQNMVKKVQKHFLWHRKPEKYDMFNMILHSIWFNRVFQISV